MKTTADYLDALRVKFKAQSDYALAPLMGWKRQQVSRYRTMKETFNDETAIRIATALEIDPADIIISMRVQVSKEPAVRGVWERIAQRVAAGILVAAGIGGIAPPPASAATLHNLSGASEIYIMRQKNRRKKRAGSSLSAMAATLAATLGISPRLT